MICVGTRTLLFLALIPGVSTRCMFVFGDLLQAHTSRAASGTAESIPGTAQGSRHPQGWSERKQVLIISCEVEGEVIVEQFYIDVCF